MHQDLNLLGSPFCYCCQVHKHVNLEVQHKPSCVWMRLKQGQSLLLNRTNLLHNRRGKSMLANCCSRLCRSCTYSYLILRQERKMAQTLSFSCRKRSEFNNLFLAIDSLLPSGHRNLSQLLVDHLIRDLSRVHGQQLVLLFVRLALDLLEVTIVLQSVYLSEADSKIFPLYLIVPFNSCQGHMQCLRTAGKDACCQVVGGKNPVFPSFQSLFRQKMWA